MTIDRATRLQFAISEIVDILTEDLTTLALAAIAKQESAQPQPAPAQVDSSPDTGARPQRLLRRAEVEERTSLRKSTIYKWIERGTFSAPVRLGSTLR